MTEKREKILKIAMLHMQGIDLEKSDYSDKRSLFGVLQRVIASAEHEKMPKEKDVIERVTLTLQKLEKQCARENARVLGFRGDDIKELIAILFGRDKEFLSSRRVGNISFHDFSFQDFFSYIEICRRIYVAKPIFPSEKQMDQKRKIQPQTQSSKADWSFDGFGVLKIKKDLDDGNKACAKFVLEEWSKILPRQKGKEMEKMYKLAKAIVEPPK